jgi:hypothetical protein
MLGQAKGARRYNERVMLTQADAVEGEYGHPSFAKPVDVLEVFAYVRQMSASKTMMTFQQADAVGLEIELRNPHVAFNGIRYRGHDVHFAQPEDVDGRGRILRISGWYQTDNPTMV